MLTGVSSMATRQVLADLAAQYEARHRVNVTIESIAGVEAARRVHAGEPFDVAILASDALDHLAAAGHIVPTSRVDVARSAMAMAIVSGHPHPRIEDEAGLGRAILAAGRVGYSTGPSGTHLLRLFERLGIMETLRPRLVQAPPGVPVGTLIAHGEVEVGFQQLSELVDVRGIEIVHLPASAQSYTIFSGGVCTASTHPREAADFLAYLASPGTTAIKQRRGMEPAAAR